jgi:basic membrane lipoprotein Med (substrate-binding protein (PBP1-ABC) superfamily)
MEQGIQRASVGQRWSGARPTKTMFFWCCVGSILLTMLIGFTWGGWVRGATALSMADERADDAVAKRLAAICVAQAKADPSSTEKLKEAQALSGYERGDYVKKQGWARMPGESEADGKVADECARLIGQ